MAATLKINETFAAPADNVTLKVEHARYAPLFAYGLPGRDRDCQAVAITLPVSWRRYGVAHPGNELRAVGVCSYDGAVTPAGKKELGDEQWFGFSVKVPASTKLTGTNITICQWHGGAAHTEPHLALRLQDTGRFKLLLRPAGNGQAFDGPALEPDRWYDVIIHAKWSSTPNGFARVWIDGEPIADFAGATVRNPPAIRITYLKFGLYIPDWRSAEGDEDKTLLFSAVRLAGADGDRAAVDPNRGEPALDVAALRTWLGRLEGLVAEGRGLVGVG